MTDLEISKRLALAIGWECDQICEYNGVFYVADWPRKDNRKTVLLNSGCYPPPMLPWQKFDYRDWNIIGPIAERYDCFPYRLISDGTWVVNESDAHAADTPQKAIALAVIGAKT